MERKLKHERFMKEREAKLRLQTPPQINVGRELNIYTWGIHRRDECPVAVERQYDAEKLTGNRDHIHCPPDRLMHSPRFLSFAHAIVEDIETQNLNSIAIHCCKGQCRSVAVATISKACTRCQQSSIWKNNNQITSRV